MACPMSSPRSGPASICCSRPRIPRRRERIERALIDAAGRGAVRRGRDGRHGTSSWPRSGRGSARPESRPTSMSSAAPSIERSPRNWRPGRSRSSRIRAGCCRSAGTRSVASWRSCPDRPTSRRPTRPRPSSRRSRPPSVGTMAEVDEVVVEPEPDAASIAAVRDRADAADVVVIGTIDGHRLRSQIDLVEAVVATGTPTIAVAMRGPWDVAAYPAGVDGARDVLDPAGLARRPRGRARRRGRGRRSPPGPTPRRHRMTLRDEILEQPEVAARFLRRAPEVVGPLVESMRAHEVDHVVIAARGTSDHAAIYAQYVLGVRHALSVGLGTPSVISLYGAQPRLDRSLVVGISQSGASPDVVAVIEAGRAQGAPDAGDHQRPGVAAGARRGDVRSTSAQGPSSRSRRPRPTRPSCWRSPRCRPRCRATRPTPRRWSPSPTRWLRRSGTKRAVESMAREQASADRLLVLARGYEYATAREWALKLKELARVFADPYSAADFEHGPLALLEPGVPVLATVRPGPTAAPADRAARTAAGRTSMPRSRWYRTSPTPSRWRAGRSRCLAGRRNGSARSCRSWSASSTPCIWPRARGLDPERPRNLNKVTRTR